MNAHAINTNDGWQLNSSYYPSLALFQTLTKLVQNLYDFQSASTEYVMMIRERTLYKQNLFIFH